MTPAPRLALLPLLLLLAAGLATACGGGGGGDGGGDPTATAVSDISEEPGATATASSAGTTISGTIEGDFVAPDSHAFTQRFEVAGLAGEQSAVIIGPDAWIREAAGDWVMLPSDDPDVVGLIDLTSADPTFLDALDLGDDLAALDSEPEEINGVATLRYFIPREAVAALVDVLGSDFIADAGGLTEFEMTVWLDEDTGAVIRADMQAVADPNLLGDTTFTMSPDATVEFTIRIDRTNVNDPDIVIEPPVGEASEQAGSGQNDRPFQSYHYKVDLLIEIIEP